MTTTRSRTALWVAGILTATALASCSSESASERLQNISNDEWEGMSEAEQMELIQEAAEEAGPGAEEDVEGDEGATELAVGDTYTYPDGLEVSIGSYEPHDITAEFVARMEGMTVELVANNPTDDVIHTTQAWVSATYGDTGTQASEQMITDTEGYETLEAILQPGAEARALYGLDIPVDQGHDHVIITVEWYESNDREAITFAVP